ncbi:MAG: NAD(+) synthase [Bacteriovoracaceae bacterium]
MQIFLHQTGHTIADFDSIFENVCQCLKDSENPGIHVFPELFLTGYPLQDLCLQKSFINPYLKLLDDINNFSKKLSFDGDSLFLFGGLTYKFDTNGLPTSIKNSVFKLFPGKELEPIYHKILLPNYDIFDEKKYFKPGGSVTVLPYKNRNFAIQICEDMWPSSGHPHNPLEMLIEVGTPIDALINLSASPYDYHKPQARIDRAKEITETLRCPMYYVNKVGSEDEVIFDGGSFSFHEGKIQKLGKRFETDIIQCELADAQKPFSPVLSGVINNTWEKLYSANIEQESKEVLPKLKELSDDECEEILEAISFGIEQYARKCGFKKLLVALSGGIDSTLVLTIISLFLKDKFEIQTIYMPGLFSRSMSYDLSDKLCDNLKLRLKVQGIKFLHSATRNLYRETFNESIEGTVADENIQSRLRGALLYLHANKIGAMVLNTSNKSEIAVGYSTQYGDSVGAISPLGDLYKSEVFKLCRYINKKYGEIIPVEIIERPPSAELREDQVDSESLPDYERLDPILECFLSNRYDANAIANLGFDPKEIKRAQDLLFQSEFKRSQFCPILKLKPKSFGFGHRVPISKYYFHQQ